MLNRNRAWGWYVAGMLLAIAYIAAAELIWVPDPFVWPGGLTWLETIDGLLYALALVPLLWLVGAWQAWRYERKNVVKLRGRAWGGVRLVPRVGAVAGSVLAIAFVLLSSRGLTINIGLLAIAWLFVVWDLFVIELAQSGRRHRFPFKSSVALVIQLLLLALFVMPIPYNVTYPGLTMNMNHYAQTEGGKDHGRLRGVLVFERRAFPADWLLARLLPIYELNPVPANEPPLREAYAEVVAMKTEAESVAAAVAMGKLGLGKGAVEEGVTIMAVSSEGAARGALKAGDLITGIEGASVSDIVTLNKAMAAVTPGSTAQVTLSRQGQQLSVAAPTSIMEDEQNSMKKRAVFGISVQTAYRYDIPRNVHFERPLAHIGGPSHGAMLTLTIMDQLTPSGVTYGWRVAGTGTIEPDGSVGPVGGVRQKAYAVNRTDADVFFVPASEASEAILGAPHLNIVPVKTIDDMLNWLRQHAK
ncbi:PDZ/DHR/GLGF domain protein [Paenibacillus curdlanolyticus YK9]|uniref:PDZ/DHR/GLGF domain protein n=1 Tax=Paenibacillus curdlanolyticus YK9 TaxID=717606 RepID=E0I9Z9_9BACL|nr:PDZ domain-containing protein [Paenibacillus curdlanolyticus]EFM10576.1 PDZ/DHR/GLGF domain protein [Paenibacillus curdlanolyticus YK9]